MSNFFVSFKHHDIITGVGYGFYAVTYIEVLPGMQNYKMQPGDCNDFKHNNSKKDRCNKESGNMSEKIPEVYLVIEQFSTASYSFLAHIVSLQILL